MHAHFVLELKKQPWLLHLFCLTVLVVLFGVFAIKNEVSVHHGSRIEKSKMVWAGGTTDAERDFLINKMNWELKEELKNVNQSNVHSDKVKVKVNALTAIKDGKYLQADSEVL